jgi:hypothetical protein
MSFRKAMRAIAVTAFAASGLIFMMVTSASTQQMTARQPSADESLMMYFYNDPQPARLVGFLERYQSSAPNWAAFPPVAGFLAVVFRRYPNWIGKLIPNQPDSRTAVAVDAALQLSGQPTADGSSLQSRLTNAGADATLKAALANLPGRLEDLHVVTPTHLDLLWGASFASGDERYARTIADFIAATANRSEPIAIEVAKVTLAVVGGPQEPLRQLQGKYGDQFAREILFAAVATWGLEANARAHPFIDEFLTKYIAANSSTPTAKLLTAVRQKKQN